jgi:ferredoxin-NADP reductase
MMNALTTREKAPSVGFHACRCVSVHQETSSVKTIVLERPEGADFSFLPGQYVTLEIPGIEGPFYRCYSIVSSPTRLDAIELSIKTSDNGRAARWLNDTLTVGTSIGVSSPAGDFYLREGASGRYLFVAGGVGMTPFMSMVRATLGTDNTADIHLIQCVPTVGDVLFKRELEDLASRCENFVFSIVTSRSRDSGSGRLNKEKLLSLVSDCAAREVYCCGPESLMEAICDIALEVGIAPEMFHREDFTLPEVSLPSHRDPGESATHDVRFIASGLFAQASADESLVDAAKRAGLVIPTGCLAGVCGTCRIRVLSGQVDMTDSGGILEEEIEAGYVLACCSRPRTSLDIDA